MTSEEIKNLKRGFGDNPIPSEQLIRITDGIWEVACQLAVANERNAPQPMTHAVKLIPIADKIALSCTCGMFLGTITDPNELMPVITEHLRAHA